MRVAIIGGSAFCTPRLIRYLAGQVRQPITITLIGRTPRHIGPVLRASRLVAAGSKVFVDARAIGGPRDLSDAVRGAAVVLIQMRVGGFRGRWYDETFPLKFGICGDEGLGPGGLSAAWRAWPVMRTTFECIQAVCPRARLLMLSSPVGLLVRLAAETHPDLDIAGLCELPFTTLRDAARAAGREHAQLEWDYIGVNHIGWFYRFGTSGLDLFNVDRPLALKYVRLHQDRVGILDEQRRCPGARALELQRLRDRALAVFRDGTTHDVEEALTWRNANWYDEAVGPLLRFLNEGIADRPFFLSLPQRGMYANFAENDIIEVPHATSKDGRLLPKPVSTEPPRELLATLSRFVRYERTAAGAIMSGDVKRLREAVAQHPWVSDAAVDGLTRAVRNGRRYQ